MKKVFGAAKNRKFEQQLASQTSYYENALAEQRERITALLKNEADLNASLDEYKKREKDVAEVMLVVAEKASEMETDLKLQYALEIERLKLFQAKWIDAYETLAAKYGFEKDVLNLQAVAVDTALSIEKMLGKEFGIRLTSSSAPEEHFKKEAERLSSEKTELYDLISSLKKRLGIDPEEEAAPDDDLKKLADTLAG